MVTTWPPGRKLTDELEWFSVSGTLSLFVSTDVYKTQNIFVSYTYGALASIYSSRTLYVGVSTHGNTTQ